MNKTLKNVIIGVISCIAIVLLCNFSYNLNNKKESKKCNIPKEKRQFMRSNRRKSSV